MLASASLGLAAPAWAQTDTFATTNEPATWVGGTGTNQWNNQNNWLTQSGGRGVPLLIGNFTNLAAVNNRTVRDQNNQSIGTLNFTAPSYVLSLENGNTFTVNGTGFVINAPANRPIVNVGVVGGGTIKFINASTGDVAKFVIAPNGTLDMSGRSTQQGMTAGAIDNAGRIIIANSNASNVGNELTVFGTYNGLGGSLYLRTDLGPDSSPSDKLIINGNTATIDGPAQAVGGTLLHIIPGPNSPGAYTVANGIQVVEAINGGTTADSAFALAGEVRAGFYDYRLYRGGFNGSSPDDWFLRSTFNGGNGNGGNGNGGGNGGGNGNGGGGPITPPDELPPEALPEDLPPALPPGVYPVIGPEIATYGVVQPMARQLGLATLSTLHERIGDTLATRNAGTGADGPSTAWARGFGQQINNHYRAFADPRTDGQLAGFQSGIDLWQGSLLPAHRDVAGIYFAYANANVDVTGLVTNEAATNYVLRKTGSLNLNAWSGGSYWTHYGPTGWYLDAVLQATVYQGTASTIFAKLPTDGIGFVSSLEAGYPIPLPAFGPGFVLEPQAQIVWQHVSFDDANDGLGDIGLGTTSGAGGRIGLRGRWTIVGDDGRVWQPYVRANLWRDWGAQATTMFSGVDRVPLLEQGTRLDLGAGLTTRINAGLSLYAQAGYQFAVGDTDGHRRDGIKGDLGLRFSW